VRSSAAALALAAAVLTIPAGRSHAAEIARDGRASLVVVLPSDTTAEQLTASRELVDYLSRVTSAHYRIVDERSAEAGGPAIRIASAADLAAEEWRIEIGRRDVRLSGGEPRGLLYAVYHFLEDRVGVRWWTPYEEFVPARPDLRLEPGVWQGRPAFRYRDIQGVSAPPRFFARSRINGHFSRLSADHGGRIAYGPPQQVHDFLDYVPPRQFFRTHPEYYALVDGERRVGDAQLCLTNHGLQALIAGRLRGFVEQARQEARALGEPAPLLFNISPEDWGGACTCPVCAASAARAGSESGPLLEMINAVAEAVQPDYPEIRIDTLAYYHTFRPPRGVRPRHNVVVRLAGLQYRDYARGARHPANEVYRRAVEEWAHISPTLRIWDYNVNFGDDGDLPLDNLDYLADDYRFYREQGIDGLFVQHEFAVGGDLHDLKLYVTVRLLENPDRDTEQLVRGFTDGYYGAAAVPIRRYLALRRAAFAATPGSIRAMAPAADYVWLDADFFREAQVLFERAERAVADAPELLRRVRHARLSLDRAQLSRLPASAGDPATLAARYRATYAEQVRMRLPAYRREDALAGVDADIERWLGQAYIMPRP